MKRYLLSYNSLTKNYSLDYGCFDRNRENMGKLDGGNLIKKLKDIMPAHRQIILYGEIDMDNSVKDLLSRAFKNTRVDLKFIKDLLSLC